MDAKIQFAITPEEREAVYRLRYEIYVEERHSYNHLADHKKRILTDAHDDSSRLLYAGVDDQVVGALRLTWGADAAFSEETMTTYDLQRFLPVLSKDQIIILSRFMTKSEFRGTGLSFQLLAAMFTFFAENGIQLAFCDCRPHLINTYMSLGFRTYAKTYNDPVAGLLVPLVMVIEDLDYLAQVHSPILPILQGYSFQSDVPAQVAPLIPQSTPIQSMIGSEMADYWSKVHDLLSHHHLDAVSIFDDLSDEEVTRFLTKSHVIECNLGDKIIGKGSTDRTVFIVLEGIVEIRDGNQVVAVISDGDVIGEVAFLLHSERTADVYAATGEVKILSLNEKTLLNLIESEPTIAAKLLHNLAKLLSMKLTANARHTFKAH